MDSTKLLRSIQCAINNQLSPSGFLGTFGRRDTELDLDGTLDLKRLAEDIATCDAEHHHDEGNQWVKSDA